MKNGFKGILMLIGGIGLIAYVIYSAAFLDIPKLFLYGMFIIGLGAISVGFSSMGCRGIAIPFTVAMMLGSVYLIYKLVTLLIAW